MHRFPIPALALTVLALIATPTVAQDGEGLTFAPVVGSSFTEKFWIQSQAESGLPGSMMLFLSEGTMIQTSCWEGYRLSSWQMLSDTALSWQEDTQTIEAEIIEVDEAELILALHLVDGTVEQHFQSAPVPFVCPDMPR
ncbi:MAG TPA: hypothetical protein VNS12_10810 [Pelagibacterium sp.]|uniref:hypothetical protein n=1 Tax=Pelagibacterium sp. TaxID=1967288 RepID=UPI002D141785|nr:hypothetical protein [Pelagibacterium sp.]HWJ88551.1 hypothetical protein [Pelagibacterium sp.]